MKCQACGSDIGSNTVCPICGSETESVQHTASGFEEPVKTRSRTVLLILAFLGLFLYLGLNDLYLYNFKRFLYKILILITTCSIGFFVWQIYDIVQILKGESFADTHGNPVV